MSSVYNGRSSISKNLCSKSTHKSIKTQLIEHRIEWKAIIITLIEMSGRKRKQLNDKSEDYIGEDDIDMVELCVI